MTRLNCIRPGALLRPAMVCTLWAWVGGLAFAQESSIQPLNIRPEPLSIEPGKPLSVRALVTHPSPLNDVLSWTFESRRHRGILYAMAVSPDRRQMATGGLDGTVRIWDIASGELVRRVGRPRPDSVWLVLVA